MIYLVTRNSHYYPLPGIADWIGLTRDPIQAVAAYNAFKADDSDVFIISIDPETLTYAQRTPDEVLAERTHS